MTAIEWTDKVWNPSVGCSRVSSGCKHCYAERRAHRGMVKQHRGLTTKGARWNGKVRLLPERLDQPLRWRKPRMVFVNSMSDLFHPKVPDEFIAAVFGVMAACPQHTFQVLTKRPERAREWFGWLSTKDRGLEGTPGRLHACWCALRHEAEHHPLGDGGPLHTQRAADPAGPWPLPNVWLGVSVEDQETADERIPLLLECPAAVRFVSYEPALGPVDFLRFMWPVCDSWPAKYRSPDEARAAGAPVDRHRQALVSAAAVFLNWVIVGGESGPGARTFNYEWALSTVRQCRDAGVPCFVKQLGANVLAGARWNDLGLKDRKGGDMSEWPTALRVREWPEVRA